MGGCRRPRTLGMCEQLDPGFIFAVNDDERKGESVRVITIQCPGVEPEDVSAEVIPNGCVVSLRRRGSLGVKAATWEKRFQFCQDEGLFELVEELARLDRGLLELALRRP